MYANDLAYSSTVSKAEYIADASSKNALAIAWEMTEEMGELKPLRPVCVLTKDLLFDNLEPMEIGNKYSWEYWAAHRNEIKETENRLKSARLQKGRVVSKRAEKKKPHSRGISLKRSKEEDDLSSGFYI